MVLSYLMNRENKVELNLPAWAFPVFLLDAIFLIPIWLLVNYTLLYIYPVFTIIENENPPAYDPVVLPDSDDAALDEEAATTGTTFKPTDGAPRTVTSSLRSINRLLRANGGFRANFRGFFCAFVQSGLTSIVASLFSFGPIKPFATLLAELTLVQYAAAWVHIVISEPSPKHFWRRLPPFKRTFDATWQPVVLYWAATEINKWIPLFFAQLIGLPITSSNFTWKSGNGLKDANLPSLLKSFAYVASIIAIYLVVVIPARVVLIRVQASLLPPDEDAIIPFDRTFEGKVEPAVVGGRGYATVKDAWSTFSRTGWRRVIVLHLKVFAISMTLMCLTWGIIIPELFLMGVFTDKKAV